MKEPIIEKIFVMSNNGNSFNYTSKNEYGLAFYITNDRLLKIIQKTKDSWNHYPLAVLNGCSITNIIYKEDPNVR